MTTEERIARVEKMARRWQLGFMTLSGIVLLLVCFLGYREVFGARVIRTQRLVVVGERGIPVIEMKRDDDGDADIRTFNAKGDTMVSISTTPTGGAVNLFNQLGHVIVGMQSNKFHSGSLSVRDHDGNVQDSMSGGRSPAPQTRAMSGGRYYY